MGKGLDNELRTQGTLGGSVKAAKPRTPLGCHIWSVQGRPERKAGETSQKWDWRKGYWAVVCSEVWRSIPETGALRGEEVWRENTGPGLVEPSLGHLQ